MAPKIYEIKILRERWEVRDIDPFLTSLNLDDADKTADLLNRHLIGAVLRSGARRNETHLYHIEVRDITSDGKGTGRPLFRWALPAEESI